MHLDCPLTSCRVLSRRPLTVLSVCVCNRHGDVKLQGNATDSFVSNASIVDFFATMIGISIIDILLVDRFFFNVSCTSPVVVRHGRRRDRRLH